MAKGEGSEQYSNTNLLQNKPLNEGDVKLATKSDRGGRLTVCNKICYAIGGAPYQITGCALGFFLQIYLLDVAQLDPFYASIILFVGRAWDAVTDPTVGFLVSRSCWTRFGRMMPWILLSTPFAVASYFLIWYVPSFDQGKVIWYLVFYCLFQTLQTCFHVPYSSLTMFISSEQKERDSATAYRMTVEVLGSVLGTAIQGQIVGGANVPCIPSALDLGRGVNATVSLSEVNVTKEYVSLDELVLQKKSYMVAAGVIGIVYIVCAFIVFFGVRERPDPTTPREKKPISFFQGLRLVMGHGPYAKLVMGFLFTSLAFMLLEGNFALFCTYTLGFRNDFQNILLAIMISATLTIPFWQWFLTKFGKKTAVYFGISWVIPFMILIVLIESNLIVTYVVSVAAGISVAAAFLLPWSMLPDVIDDFKICNPQSQGHEAIFYSFYVFFTKFASGVSLGISTLSLDFAGYLTRGCSQPDAVNLTLKMLVSPAPIVLIILGLIIFKLYPINEETRQKNKKILQDMRNPAGITNTTLRQTPV
ncbi:sodium-dependent lysophosphatidylcholine symporter 1-B-like isoform X1 [Acipenser ruthenus]|uniref:sodium-dependent lysophosphatidylcholine symporter 1-B-like isoform X1 n=1 Tax=Acipenser ruthenus TaxID=7906 RepID=UPI00145A2C36|nr:sodium-dependent lysophosphatidylcholine symporter 1-B-like isoform X1 [Acipenser ruthenus]